MNACATRQETALSIIAVMEGTRQSLIDAKNVLAATKQLKKHICGNLRTVRSKDPSWLLAQVMKLSERPAVWLSCRRLAPDLHPSQSHLQRNALYLAAQIRFLSRARTGREEYDEPIAVGINILY